MQLVVDFSLHCIFRGDVTQVMNIRFIKSIMLLVFCAALMMTGCTVYTDLPAGTRQEVTGSAIVEQEAVNVPVFTDTEPPSADYLVGPGDVLFVVVEAQPDMGSPVLQSAHRVQGNRIDGLGRIHLPLVGAVQVGGLSINDVAAELSKAYSTFLKDPWVVVEVSEFKSQPLYLIGQFREAGTLYMERPLTLMQGLSEGGGLLDSANLRSARLIREKQTMPVDLLA